MKKYLLILLSLASTCAFSQVDLDKAAKDIETQGKKLYQLETAAWHGTDIFFENFKESDRIGGYFSYIEKDTPKCLFFSRDIKPKVIGVVSFGDIKVVETATIDFKERDFKPFENDLYQIRAKAITRINQDTLYKMYNNTNLNLIPIIENGKKEVYILTAPKTQGSVLFGNDYLITFNNENNIVSQKALHSNLIPVSYENKEEKISVASVHSHASETGDFITPTDICTLMLYCPYTTWKQHIVVSKDYASVWDCNTETFKIYTREDFMEIEHQYLK